MDNYTDAIPYIANVYGEEEQLTQLAEESAELAQAALKRRKAQIGQIKYGNTRDALAEEIADTLIMIEQIVYLEGFEDDVRRIIDEKISRQLDRIKGVTNK